MSQKILATFRCEPDKWKRFKADCRSNETNASAMLLQFIDWYLLGNTIPSITSKSLDSKEKNLDNKEISIDSDHQNSGAYYLEERLSSLLNERIDKKLSSLNHNVEGKFNGVYTRLELVEKVIAGLSTEHNAPHQQSRQQQIAPSQIPDWTKISTRILNSIGVGKQAKVYKKVKAELDRIIFEENSRAKT